MRCRRIDVVFELHYDAEYRQLGFSKKRGQFSSRVIVGSSLPLPPASEQRIAAQRSHDANATAITSRILPFSTYSQVLDTLQRY